MTGEPLAERSEDSFEPDSKSGAGEGFTPMVKANLANKKMDVRIMVECNGAPLIVGH